MCKLKFWAPWQIHEVIRCRILEKLRCRIMNDKRLIYDSSLRIYSVQRSYSPYLVKVYSGTAWAISRIKPLDAWLVSLCLHLYMNICVATNSIGDARTLSNRRDETQREFAVSLRKGNNVTSLFYQSSLFDRKLSFSFVLLTIFPVHSRFTRSNSPWLTILVRPSCLLAPASVYRSVLSSCDIAPMWYS